MTKTIECELLRHANKPLHELLEDHTEADLSTLDAVLNRLLANDHEISAFGSAL